MTIKENIQLINELLNNSYTNLQKLAYEEEIERCVRVRLLDITQTAKDILEFTHSQEVKQHKNKNGIKKVQI